MRGIITRLKTPLQLPFGWGFNLVSRWSARRVGLVLLYHRVGDPQEEPRAKLVPALGTKLFETQMLALQRRYRVVPASELPTKAGARRRGQRFPVAVTFDDDDPCHVQTTMPILRRLGVPATFFLSGASLQAPFSFWYERLQLAFDRGGLDAVELMGRTSEPTHRPASADIHELGEAIMALPPEDRDRVAERLLERVGADRPEAGIRAAGVRALANAGFEIGFHTRRHDTLTGLDDDALGRALEDGRAELAAEVGGELSMIAYPHGSVDARVASAARAAGYRLGFTAEPRPMGPEDDPMLIGRIEPRYESFGRFSLRMARALRSAPPR